MSDMRSDEEDREISRLAERLEALLPGLLRRLFTLEPEHPTAELPLGQLRVCLLLQAGPLTMSDLSVELGVSVSAVTQLADRLEKSLLVERADDTVDRRVKRLRLTPFGIDAMASRRVRRRKRVEEVLTRVSPEHRHDALRVLEALYAAARHDGDPSDVTPDTTARSVD